MFENAPSLLSRMQKGERFVWLNVVVGLTVAILLSTGIVLFLRALGVGYDLGFVEHTLAGSLLIAFEIVLFFGIRALARTGLHYIPKFRWSKWLDSIICASAALLLVTGLQLIALEAGAELSAVRFVFAWIISASVLAAALGLFFGMRTLAQKDLNRTSSGNESDLTRARD